MESNDAYIRGWGLRILSALKGMQRILGIKFSTNSQSQKMRVGFKRSRTGIVRIDYNMTKGLIMTHKPAGRGGPENRTEKAWFNPVIEENIGELADNVARNTGETLSKSIFI